MHLDAGGLVGSVRARLTLGPADEGSCGIGRLMVAPDLQGRGLGRAEARAPAQARSCALFTGLARHDNLGMRSAAGSGRARRTR
ncbi:hypothetical protein [Saccharopolyspora griseoalba]|uniref:N-acetyltransferase domain-containing protein n=1 Tax=Saccharopolyspora griseoalba TaxID=1431848 RepID=A0ABW2LFI0_9PSEU